MKIFIKTLTGKSYDLDVNPSDTIQIIKGKIQEKERISLEEIKIIFAGKQLENDKRLEDYDIMNESTVHVILGSNRIKKISIKTNDGKILSFDAKPSDTIKNFKEKIKDEEGLDPTQFQLFLDTTLLKDDKTLGNYYSLNSDSIIKIVQKGVIQIKNLNGKIIDIEAKLSDTIEKMKEKIRDIEGLVPTKFHLFYDNILLINNKTLQDYNLSEETIIEMVLKDTIQLKNMDGKTIDIEAKPYNTIKSIKEKIKKKEEISQCRCELMFKGKQLEDCKTLEDYAINEKSIIYFKLYKIIEIILNINGEKELSLNVECKDTIRKVKNKINNIEEIIPDRYKLLFEGIELEDKKTIEDYDIQNSNILYLIQIDKIQIFEENLSGKQIIIKVESMDTSINEIKTKLENQEGISKEKYNLVFNGIKLDDYNTLEDYNINSKSEIILKYYKNFKILINDGEKKFYINANSSDKIEKIKNKIKLKNNVPINNYLLEFNGIKLEDFKLIDDYDLEQKKDISFNIIYCPLINIFVKSFNGEIFNLNVETSLTILDIKKKIQNKFGVNKSLQNLIFAGKTLEDNKTLDYYCIPNYSSVELVLHLTLRLRGGH